MKGVAEDRLEGAFDAILDFDVDEASMEPRNLMRIRSMRTAPYDPDWRGVKITPNFEVTVERRNEN